MQLNQKISKIPKRTDLPQCKFEKIRKTIKLAHQKKIEFHLQRTSDYPQPLPGNSKRKQWKNASKKKKRKSKERYKKNKKERKDQWLQRKTQDISTSVVRNLSATEIPDVAYLYLARGMNFVESKQADKEDLRFDSQNFLRKLEWKAYFHENPKTDNSFEEDEHQALRIPSRNHPEGYNNPLMEEIKAKVLGYVNNFQPKNPSSNLTPAEKRGKAWVLQKIDSELIFVTKADKGGATLILDYTTAVNAVTASLGNAKNFTASKTTVEEKMKQVRDTVNKSVLLAAQEKRITEKDKKLIAGLNENNNMMHGHVFKPVVPYVYPLFKIHKLSSQQILDRVTPPTRLIHATREGPLYRLEKWVSPYLTKISRDYCKGEFILDSPDLLSQVKIMNNGKALERFGPKLNLFTLDVISLYPSIDPEIALEALRHSLVTTNMDTGKNSTVESFTKLIFDNSFVTFQKKVYVGNKGIPTGNCVSRQVADITLHWLLFYMVMPDIQESWDNIEFLKRFIDDILGIWTGTRRQFDLFLQRLNSASQQFGIQFGDFQFGKSVDYLDLTFSLGQDNRLEYKLFKKETDARLYLQTDSFHPSHVFESVVFSQMIRVIQRNSQDHTCVEDLQQLKIDLMRSGHKEDMLEEMEPKAVLRAIENELYSDSKTPKAKTDKVVFTVKFFEEVSELKKLIGSIREDIEHLCGDVQIIFALRKQPSIGNAVVRNRRLSEGPRAGLTIEEDVESVKDQKCRGRGCGTCPYLFKSDEKIMVNGERLRLDYRLNCKSSGIIYIAQCTLCSNSPQKLKEDTYFGQTVSPMHVRMNGHRSKFKIDSTLTYEKSALSMHCFLAHKSSFSMSFYKLGIVKKVKPVDLDREEARLIDKFRTKIWGLNRIVVVR